MNTDYVSRQHMMDVVAIKDGEIENLKRQIALLLQKAAK